MGEVSAFPVALPASSTVVKSGVLYCTVRVQYGQFVDVIEIIIIWNVFVRVSPVSAASEYQTIRLANQLESIVKQPI